MGCSECHGVLKGTQTVYGKCVDKMQKATCQEPERIAPLSQLRDTLRAEQQLKADWAQSRSWG